MLRLAPLGVPRAKVVSFCFEIQPARGHLEWPRQAASSLGARKGFWCWSCRSVPVSAPVSRTLSLLPVFFHFGPMRSNLTDGTVQVEAVQ